MTARPYVFTAAFCLLNTAWLDRSGNRSWHMVWPSVAAGTGIVVTLATTNTWARYAVLFVMLPGTYACFQISNAWMANIAARPRRKRAVALAMNNALGNTALVWTPHLYPDAAGPRYTVAWAVNLALTAVTIASSVALGVWLRRGNGRMEAEEGEEEYRVEVVREKSGGSEHLERRESEMIGNEDFGAAATGTHRREIEERM